VLSPADAALVAQDRQVPGLALLLDADALGAWLGVPVRRRYVRYKPGTGCVLGLDVAGRRAFVTAHAPEAAGKLSKAVERAPRATLLAVDRSRLVLAARPPADRDLPGLGQLSRDPDRLLRRVLPERDVTGSDLRALSYKPQRRWVGLLTPAEGEPVVLRVHRPQDAGALVRSAKALERGAGLAAARPTTPRLLGAHARAGVVAVSWLPGGALHDLVVRDAATPDHLRAAGAALAALHARPPGRLAPRTATDDAQAVEQAATAVAGLLPELGPRARALADALSALLAADRTPDVTVHGDFSADQVVLGPDGTAGLVDLDAVAAGEAALDLGSAVAALVSSAVVGAGQHDGVATAEALLDGYAAVAPLPTLDRLDLHVSAALLRRAAEPFRLCADDWAAQVERSLVLAEAHLPTRGHG